MNHWFLCGRDVMWGLVGLLPLFLSSAGGWSVAQRADTPGFFTEFWLVSIIIQAALLNALHYGVIK